jgi:hypothetical protein
MEKQGLLINYNLLQTIINNIKVIKTSKSIIA